jgi:hypothetical protein
LNVALAFSGFYVRKDGKSERSEQQGFTNLLIGLFDGERVYCVGTRTAWPMSEQHALDLLPLV